MLWKEREREREKERERGGKALFFAFRCNNEFGVEFLTVEGREENDVCY